MRTDEMLQLMFVLVYPQILVLMGAAGDVVIFHLQR